ncbi:PD-(D/E)XK motif protein [Streptomyces sp. NPDC058430]|uniref:PD-(D/E)XK motif protein n=1 Tax=Streptomyces sp. NPDC058430 TaxID=3346495 RepID=UPI003660EBE5
MTSISPDAIFELFNVIEHAQAAPHGSSRRRLLPDHPLDVFLEVRFPGKERSLVIASTERLGDRELVLANGLTCRFQEGYVEVVAQPATDTQIFCTLLADLVDHLEGTTIGPAAAVMRRIASWQRMLGRGLGGGLSLEARIGLFGELLVLRDLIIPACGENAIAAWQGPTGGAKDFALASWAVEVKTVVGARSHLHCRIHGEEQLDEGTIDFLALVHQKLRNDPSGVGLPHLVDELRAHPALVPQRALLENNLLEAGWLEAHRSQYDGERWLLDIRRCFRVTETFPRIVSGMLPRGVSGVSYDLDLGACAQASVEETQVRAVIDANSRHPGEATVDRD